MTKNPNLKQDNLVKSPTPVTPANAGVQKLLKLLDSGLRRNDDLREIQTFYESIKQKM
jgi:hypothetical protein